LTDVVTFPLSRTERSVGKTLGLVVVTNPVIDPPPTDQAPPQDALDETPPTEDTPGAARAQPLRG